MSNGTKEGLSGAIFDRFQAVGHEYLEYSHSRATIAGLAAEGVECWLQQEGLAVVKVGEVPPWMEPIAPASSPDGHGLYRLSSTEGGES